MKPKLYYSCVNGVAFDNFCSDAAIGARDEGITTVRFEDIEEIPYHPYNVVIASVEDTEKYLNKKISPINQLWSEKFLKRKSEIIDSIESISNYPCFIKPANEIKAFTGFVAENKEMVKQMTLNYKKPILKQDVVEIESEYRVYVSNLRGIIGIKHYSGNPYMSLDSCFVESCYKASKVLKEKSYTLDFGINNKGETFLIEVNDGWAIGNYGLTPKDYYHFVKNRFLQLTEVLK